MNIYMKMLSLYSAVTCRPIMCLHDCYGNRQCVVAAANYLLHIMNYYVMLVTLARLVSNFNNFHLFAVNTLRSGVVNTCES